MVVLGHFIIDRANNNMSIHSLIVIRMTANPHETFILSMIFTALQCFCKGICYSDFKGNFTIGSQCSCFFVHNKVIKPTRRYGRKVDIFYLTIIFYQILLAILQSYIKQSCFFSFQAIGNFIMLFSEKTVFITKFPRYFCHANHYGKCQRLQF